MKTSSLLYWFLLWSTSISGQHIEHILGTSDISITFFGLDFSKAKIIGIEKFKPPQKSEQYYFEAWNHLLLSEVHKYDVRRAFMKQTVVYAFDPVQQRNKKIRRDDFISRRAPKNFSKQDLQKLIDAYDTQKVEGKYGLSLVVHSFNRYQEKGYLYIVFFDIQTKEILFYEKMVGEAGGFGFRNYWARTFYNVLADIRDYKLRQWRNQLGLSAP